MRYTEPFKNSYESAHDSFLHWKFAVLPCLLVTVVTCIVQYGIYDIMNVSACTDVCVPLHEYVYTYLNSISGVYLLLFLTSLYWTSLLL